MLRIFLVALLLVGCSYQTKKQLEDAGTTLAIQPAAGEVIAPPESSTVFELPEFLPLTQELPGRIHATADEWARVVTELEDYLSGEGLTVRPLGVYRLKPGNRLYLLRDSSNRIWSAETKLQGSGFLLQNWSSM